MKLAGKVGIVPGGADGIGRVTALTLAREGADLVIADILSEKAEDVRTEIEALGRRAISIKTDVTKSEEVSRMAKTTLDRFGKVDFLVQTAGGMTGTNSEPLHEQDDKDWNRVLDVNLKGVIICSKAVIRQMIKQQSGKIVLISSESGLRPCPNTAVYGAAKAAVISFAKSLATEVVPYGITVNTVAPGWVLHESTEQTRILRHMLKEGTFKGAKTIRDVEVLRAKTIPMNRPAKPEEIAKLIVFLLSDDGDYITGCTYCISGGMVMH